MQKIDLKNLFNSFVQFNGLSVSYAARQCEIPLTNLAAWARGERPLSNRNQLKVRQFLRGDFFIPVQEVMDYIGMEGEL